MSRPWLTLVILLCLIGLMGAFFGPVLFQGQQFAYRDAGHFYYPLYHRVQQDWDAGRWPLWEPEENGGMPLLGNPTAAVLYPGKLIYTALPYAWAARIYILAHVLLAFGAMYALARHWGVSRAGSAISGLSYAFGVPVLFQYCNVIYLVGAAWAPLGLRGADRWLREGRRWGLIELAVVLAMQTLGGEPQSAYLIGLCAGGYALGLAWGGGRPIRQGPRSLVVVLIVAAVLAAWTMAALAAAAWFPQFRGKGPPMPTLPWLSWFSRGILATWGLVALIVAWRWARGRDRTLRSMLLGLASAAALAGLLTAAQLLPVAEYTSQTVRAADEGPHEIYPFSLEPVRLVELIWPNVFGTNFGGNTHWLPFTPPLGGHPKIWIPSLYVGGLTAVLALAGAGFGQGPPWRRWLTAIALVSLFGALGEFGGPLWWARRIPALTDLIGTPDPPDVPAIRLDGELRDGDGSFYWLLSSVLPLFQSFRYPSKLLSFTVLALSALAGLGWDRVIAGQTDRLRRAAIPLLVLSFVGLAAAFLLRPRFIAWLERVNEAGIQGLFGPLDSRGAFAGLIAAVVHGAILLGLALVLARQAGRWPGLTSAVALIALSADLGLANARFIGTVPQSLFETKPTVLQRIEEAERADPGPTPYRIHRVPIWEPLIWRTRPTNDRVKDFVVWEHDTIQPKYGLLHDVSYTFTLGVAELYDYEWFFSAFRWPINADTARALNATPGQRVVYYSRRGFDMWNTRYFVLPAFPADWDDEHRGIASFLYAADMVYPPPGTFTGPDKDERQRKWLEEEDVQILRNQNALPRAWIVHDARFYRPISGLGRDARKGVMEEMLYAGDSIWFDPKKPVFDPLVYGWFETTDREALAPYLTRSARDSRESVQFTRYEPQRVELTANLQQPGVLILADVYYPGWTVTIDGKPEPLYRANRLMRGVALLSGTHTVVFTYDPASFRVGLWLSGAGIALLVLLAGYVAWRPNSPHLAAAQRPGSNG